MVKPTTTSNKKTISDTHEARPQLLAHSILNGVRAAAAGLSLAACTPLHPQTKQEPITFSTAQAHQDETPIVIDDKPICFRAEIQGREHAPNCVNPASLNELEPPPTSI